MGAVKAVQTGYARVNEANVILGTNNFKYVDITISSVNINKCEIYYSGGYIQSTNYAIAAKKATGVHDSYKVATELTSSTNLRLSIPNTYAKQYLAIRWTVIEYT